MFSHHILKPERTPIEANIWGTPKSSGSFLTLFRTRLLRAIEYRDAPKEIDPMRRKAVIISAPPFSGEVLQWPSGRELAPRGIYISRGDSAQTGLGDQSVDLVVTDPPFFDNVHYSELADFFFSWQQLDQPTPLRYSSTRSAQEVQDTVVANFTAKLARVFRECHRVLSNDGLLVFTYHHSREEGWFAVAKALSDSGFMTVNAQPVKSEMSVAMPKTQSKDPIQLDIILVCKKGSVVKQHRPSIPQALSSARDKVRRLRRVLTVSTSDIRVILLGQMLTSIEAPEDFYSLTGLVEKEASTMMAETHPVTGDVATSEVVGHQLSLWSHQIGIHNVAQ